MTDHQNQNEPAPVPDVGIDQLTTGFSARLGSASLSLPQLAELASTIGYETTPLSRKGAPGYHQFTVPLINEDDLELGSVTIDLHVRRDAGGRIVTTERSAISLNPQRILRREIGYEPREGERCLDGNDNTLPCHLQGAGALPRQVALLEEVLTLVALPFLNALVEPASWTFGMLWVKRGEAFFDTAVDDALEAGRIVQHITLNGAQEVHRRAYERGASDARGVPVVHYRETKTGPILKVYAKHRHALRHEVVCKDRAQVAHLTGTARSPCTGAGIRELVLAFAQRAQPLVDRLRTHVAEALSGRVMGVDLVLRLEGLIELANGGRSGRRGPPLSDDTVQASRHLLGQLLSVGFCDATGLSPRHAHVRLLTRWAEAGAPVTKHPARQIFYLKPHYARAIRGMAPA